MTVFLLIVFILFAILVGLTIHELGHLIFAKIFKVNVKEFAIGIGPKIYSHQFEKIKLSINLIPVMAFVRIDSKKSLSIFGQIRDEYQKEANEYFINNEKLLTSNQKYVMVNKNGKLTQQSTWAAIRKYKSYLKKIDKYNILATRMPNTFIIEEVAKWKQLVIYFGGIFFNLILFAIFYLVQYFGLNNHANPLTQIGESFLILLKNMVFYNAWGSNKSAGTAIGSVSEIAGNNNGAIPINSLPLVCVNYLAIFNLMLFLFNFIPIPPLDGYKIACTLFSGYDKIKVNEKFKNGFELFGMILMLYIFLTAIIADFLM